MVGTRLHEMALHVAHNHFPAHECQKKVKHVSGFESCRPPPTNEEKYDETKKLPGQKAGKTVESKRHIAARSARPD